MNRSDFLFEIKKHLPIDPICAEIGVLNGEFSRLINNILKPSKLYLIDPWTVGRDKNSPTEKYTGSLKHLNTAYSTEDNLRNVEKLFHIEIKNNQILLRQKFSYDAVNEFDNHYFDFIYIDATHIYESVKADLEDYFPKMKPTGLMCGHDYIDHSSFTVIKAVDEFIQEYDGQIILKSSEGDFAIKFNNV